ncbi:MAG TPA: YetF domain-containing protein [Candidatus Acidoferrales bacterium]|nr:YetF domain-containing protein [Candidatus Acidoferrales bacterium]
MESVLRAVVVYTFLLFIFRISGRRTLSQLTDFDLLLMLIISEAAEQGLVGEDFSLTNALLVIVTLTLLDVFLSLVTVRRPFWAKIIEGVPTLVVENGKPLKERMLWARIDDADVLAAARERHGIVRMDEIQYAILEPSGGISIIPKRND